MAAQASHRIEFGTVPQVNESHLWGPEKDVNSPSFSSVFNSAIRSVDNLQHVASDKQTAMDMADISDDLTGTMLASQKASGFLRAMVQVSVTSLPLHWMKS